MLSNCISHVIRYAISLDRFCQSSDNLTVIPLLYTLIRFAIMIHVMLGNVVTISEIKAIGGVWVKIFILSYFKELHKGDQRLFTECQN